MNATNLAIMLLDNASDINYGNLLKSAMYVKLRESDKSDIEFVDLLNEIINECSSRFHKCDDYKVYAHIINVCYNILVQLTTKNNSNKVQLFDSLLFEIRRILS